MTAPVMTIPGLLTASRTEKLWHEMRADFERIGPKLGIDQLPCPVCGRVLDRKDFSLEHIVPRQALDDDPASVKASVTASTRSGHVLLCRAPLKVKAQGRTQGNGCNGWKGSHYDRPLRELMNGAALKPGRTPTERVVVAALAAGYLAMVARFGYGVAFTPSGLLLRRQFFSSDRLRPELPALSQMLLSGQAPPATPEAFPFWENPFRFKIEDDTCFVTVRNFVIRLPISRDPTAPVSRAIIFAPRRFLLRPDFSSVFA